MASVLSKFQVSHKILGLVGFIIIANLVVAGFILWQLNNIKSEIEIVSEEHMPLTEITTKITIHQLEQ